MITEYNIDEKIIILEDWNKVTKGEIYTIRKSEGDNNRYYINIFKPTNGNSDGGYNIPKSIIERAPEIVSNYSIY